MKILLAPDSFKGTMSSLKVIDLIEVVAKRHFSPLEVIKLPIADGGEGTVDAFILSKGGFYKEVEVSGPLPGQRIAAKYGSIDTNTAVIEMAEASGLTLVPVDQRNPLITTTYGTGELIKAALDNGTRTFIIGIGGSATNDGGIGVAQALGIQFLDANGQDVSRGGQALEKIERIVLDGLDPRIKESTFTVICDVSNPLTGPKGATAIFGPQKGVTEENFEILESGMIKYEALLNKTTGMDMKLIPGTGAAGGLGAAMIAFLQGVLKPGIDTILDFVDFDTLLEGVDLVITGEGRMDGQSVFGKVPVGIAKRCKLQNIPVAAIVGGMGIDAHKVYEYGIDSIMPTVNSAMPLEEAMARSNELLMDAADRLFRFIKAGMRMKPL